MIELSKSFQPEVKASKSVKRFQSYSHLKFCIEIQALQVPNWDKSVLKVPSRHSLWQKMVRCYRVRYTKSRKKTTSFQVLANTLIQCNSMVKCECQFWIRIQEKTNLMPNPNPLSFQCIKILIRLNLYLNVVQLWSPSKSSNPDSNPNPPHFSRIRILLFESESNPKKPWIRIRIWIRILTSLVCTCEARP